MSPESGQLAIYANSAAPRGYALRHKMRAWPRKHLELRPALRVGRERLASSVTLERVACLINPPWKSELRRPDLRYHREETVANADALPRIR
jgi:hypothetical protein